MSRFLAAIYDYLMKAPEEACLRDWRAQLLGALEGQVLEVGAGTGLNLAHYSPRVTRLVLAEPDPFMRKRLAARAEVEVIEAPVEALPFSDGSFDVVVSTLVLCSVADPARALAEISRVLKPRGKLVFLEHVAAPDGSRRLRWQHRVEPLWKRMMGNCHLTRDTERAIAQAGFELVSVERESMRKIIPVARPSIRGVALRP